MEFQQQSALIINDLLRINQEIVKAYCDALKTTEEIDLKSIFERIIQTCTECKNELETFFSGIPTESGKKTIEWKGVHISNATKKTALVICANDVLAVMNACFSALTSPEIDGQLRDLLAKQQERLSKLYFHIEQFHDAQ